MTETVLITEFERRLLPTGVSARVSHLLSEERVQLGRPLHDAGRPKPAVLARIRTAMRADTASYIGRSVIVEGLGSPPMLVFAARLRAAGAKVEFDVCDSTVLQLRERLRARDLKLIAVGLWMLALQAIHRSVPFIYIHPTDMRADSGLNRRRSSRVCRISVAPVFRTLPPFEWPASRICLAGDFSSFHNRRGLDLLLRAAELAATEIPIDLYGPAEPQRPLPSNVTYRGWADSPTEPLAGNTVVFVSNMGGSGVPNKLYEALTSGRPVILHELLAQEVPPGHPVFTFATAEDLARVIERIGGNNDED